VVRTQAADSTEQVRWPAWLIGVSCAGFTDSAAANLALRWLPEDIIGAFALMTAGMNPPRSSSAAFGIPTVFEAEYTR
jgi:hypothetical protein